MTEETKPTNSMDYGFGTKEYYQKRIKELEKDRDKIIIEARYYRKQLAKAHEILGRVIHQTSQRWDSVRITEYFPTDNLNNKRSINNPGGE